MRAAAELGVHRIDAHLDGDLDGALPVANSSLALLLVVRGPAIHRQERRDADFGVTQRLLEGLYPIREDARRLEPFEEVGARAEFDPLVSELGHFRGKLLEREMAVHEWVERNLHDVAPCCAGVAFKCGV